MAADRRRAAVGPIDLRRGALTMAPVSISLTITTARTLSSGAADALRRDLTQAARWYGIAPELEPAYALTRGAVLFCRDWVGGRQQITWAREGVDAATVAAASGGLVRTWRRIAEVHAPGCVVEFGGALAIGPAPVEQRDAA